VGRLEPRTVMNADVVSIAANPTSLWPPNGKLVPVTVSGVIADRDPVAAHFHVLDEYGAVQPSGPVSLSDNHDGTFSYAFTVPLQASRLGQDRDGRQYTIVVNASDDHSSDSGEAVVTVPHDQGRRGFAGSPDRGRGHGRGLGRGARDFVPIDPNDDGPDRNDGQGSRGRGRGRGRGRD